MKFFYLILFILLSLSSFSSHAEFPDRPIKLLVYTKAGGLMDVTARKFGFILEKHFVSTPIIIENKPGAGGVVALQTLLNKESDGYTVLGLTSSVISKALVSNKHGLLDELFFLKRVVKDYECLITNKDSGINSFTDLIDRSKSTNTPQIWVGPSPDGTDHLFAKKVWSLTGIRAKWIPYSSGGQSIAAIMGNHGLVYVGNPQDILGRSNLQVIAHAGSERLANFPKVLTFKELGFDDLTGEVLWRGFAIKKGTTPEVVEKLTSLFNQVSQHPDWLEYVEKSNVVSTGETGADFAKVVEKQIKNDSLTLGITKSSSIQYHHIILSLTLLAFLANFLFYRRKVSSTDTTLIYPIFILLLLHLLLVTPLGYYLSSFLFLLATFFVLRSRSLVIISCISIGWIAFVYLIFGQLLQIPVPIGGF